MLVGLAGVAAPIVIHLLDRTRNVPQDFPTLRLLMAAQEQSSRRSKLRHILVLLCRCLLIALLVLAMAQPYTQDRTWAAPADLPTTLVIVLDNSYSMGYRDGSDPTTRFDRAKQMALDQVEELSLADEVALVLANDRAVPVIDRPTRDHERVAERIRAAELAPRPGDMRDGLSTAFALAQLDADSDDDEQENETSDDDNVRQRREAWRQVMIISDLQRTAWEPALHDELLDGVDPALPLTIGDLSTTNASNRFIRQINVRENPVEGMVSVEAEILGHGPSRPRGGQATLRINGERAGSPELLPADDGSITLRAELPGPGIHRGEVRIESDRLAIDDRASFALNITGGRHLIVVDGKPSPVARRAGAYFLDAALSIREQRAAQPLTIEHRAPADLATQPLPDSGALILSNVQRLDGAALAEIERFLRSGGNVFVALGDQVDVEHYNDAWPFLPVRLTGRRGDPQRSRAFQVLVQEPDHPVFAEGVDLAATRFFAFLGAEPRTEQRAARVLAVFGDGSPALVEGRFGGEGGGRVLVLTGPLDATWSNFPYRRAFVPFIDQAVSHLTRQRIAMRSVTLGQTVTFEGPAQLVDRPITITLPDQTRQTLHAEAGPRGERAVAEFRGTVLPGVYEVSADPGFDAPGAFAVNLDTRGSILAPVDRATVREALGERPVRFIRDQVAATLGGWHAEDEQTERRTEWWPWLLLAALGVFVLESLLANYFTRRPSAAPLSTTQYMESRRTEALAGQHSEAETV